MKDNPVSEREIGTQILKEVIDYAESAVCRRKQILHYFGEDFDANDCNCMCDNCKADKTWFEGTDKLKTVLLLMKKLGEKFDDQHIVNVLMGVETSQIKDYKHHLLPEFGSGKEDGEIVWKSLMREALLDNFFIKEIDNYGLLRVSDKGAAFIENPYSIKFVLNRQIESDNDDQEETVGSGSGGLDAELLSMLKDLRRTIGKRDNVPPYVIFQDPSLEEMCLHYPVSIEELKQIQGVGAGKAARFGQPFVSLIKKYVEDNDIQRPVDLVVKSAANKSALKVYIIQNIDRKISLEDIADSKGISYEDVLKEVETIVNSGTRLNIDYYVDEVLDEERQDEVFEYFRTSETGSIEDALKELGTEEYSFEELQLMKVKFLSELGN